VNNYESKGVFIMNILVIDNHRGTAELIKKTLDLKGYRNTIVFDEVEDALLYLGFDKDGYRYSSSNQVDVIFIDINMPKMNGIQFCRLIKQYSDLVHIPLIMMVANENEQLLNEAFQAGAFDYICKPFTLTELDIRVQQAMKYKNVVHELKITSEVIEEHRQLYQSLFNHNSDPCFFLETNGRLLEVNEAATNIIGYSDHEYITMSIQELIHRTDVSVMENNLEKAAKGDTVDVEVKINLKSGKTEEFSISLIPVKVRKQVIGIIAIAKNITKQKDMQRKLEADLALAKSVQEGVLSAPIQNEKISIVGKYLPSMRLSGDMYCWYQIDDHRYSIILLDVMGHGVASSLVCMSVRSLLPGLMMRVTDPIRVMKELNRHIFNLFEGKTYYFTAIYLIIDVRKRTIEYLNAGHPPGILIDENGTMIELTEGSIPIGLIKKMIYQKGKLSYEGSVQIFLYTDGLLDVFGKNLKNCHDTLKSFYDIYKQHENKQMVEAIQRKIAKSGQKDDISFISIRIHP
jgi:phosphoserine phosphatase RsbU/P